ncbi:MAG: MerR family transcriptional regulator [Pseudobutyrivibrio sp.]|nr:MerR family transcriptional regulator [Pseudobutyrivibrio sp.]
MNERYSRTELSQIINVDRHTLAKWEKSGKLVPFKDKDGKKYYTEEKIEEFKRSFSNPKITFENGYVDLCDIPRDVRGGYAWKKAAEKNSSVRYSYKGVEGVLVIIGYENRNLLVRINNQEKRITAADLGNGKIAKLTGVLSYDYKYYEGQRLKDGDTDITILKQIKSKNGKAKAYKYQCNKCGQENTINEGNISNKGCCPVCKGLIVVEGFNDIATTDKWMIPFFQNKEDAKRYYHGNHTSKIHFICPDCGRIKKNTMTLDTLYRTRSIGCVCKDGFSYPNKFMYSVCEQLLSCNIINYFKDEFTAKWLGKRRFDFYLEWNSENKLIVEMDGGFHSGKSRDKNISPKVLKEIDRWKDFKAREEGIEVVRIDSTISKKDYLKEKIIDALSNYFSLEVVNWDEADKFAISNFAKEVCDYYSKNNNILPEDLANIFHIATSTARRYIHIGEEAGWCEYNYEFSNNSKYRYARQEMKEKENRIKDVCEYYNNHAPIGAKEIAKVFNIHHGTALRYLKNCEKYGFIPYDKNYTKEININKLKKTKKDSLKKAILCYSLDGQLIKRYESVTDAAKENNVTPTAISNCCKNKGTSSGKIFRYES